MNPTRSTSFVSTAFRPRRQLLGAVASALLWCCAPAHALRIESSLGSCGSPGPVVGGTIGTFTQLTQELSSAGCYAFATLMQGPGYASAIANVALRTGDWSSGGLSAAAGAGFRESVRVVNRGLELDGYVDVMPTVSFTGSATAAKGTNAGAAASISYTFSWAGGAVSGSLSESDGNGVVQTGPWGEVDLPSMVVKIGDSYEIAGRADVRAGVGKNYAPLLLAQASAIADFGSTLRWMGVEVLQVYDVNMQPIATPADFRLGLIGQDSGFDYFNAAPLPVPEPGTWALMLAGGALLLARQRRRRGEPASR